MPDTNKSPRAGDNLGGLRRTFPAMPKRPGISAVFLAFVALLLVTGYGQSASATPMERDSYAVRAVLASRQGSEFRYFPHYVGSAHCAIPFVFRNISGICSTGVSVPDHNGGQIFVNFSERWQWRKFHYSGTPRRTLHHHWVFDLLPSGEVVLARQAGDFPPNYAR